MACIVEITTWLRGSSKDDASATLLHKRKLRLECSPDSQVRVVRNVKLASSICSITTKTKVDGDVVYLITPKSKPIFISYRILMGEESVHDKGFFAQNWRTEVKVH